MNIWKLPTSLNISGVDYNIRTDFRDILKLVSIMSDKQRSQDDKWNACMIIMFGGLDVVPMEHQEEAVLEVLKFIDAGVKDEKNQTTRPVMDWEYDAAIIIPSINKVANTEIRALKHLHWWTFIGYYMEIGDGLFSDVVRMRQKLNKGKHLEKEEKEFYSKNKKLIDLPKKLTKEEQEFMDELTELFG